MTETIRYRATLAYDGAAYQGFQRQIEGTPTIQAAVEDAILRVTGQSVTVVGAGRTDSGVHALGQVIAFDVAWKHRDHDLLRAINAHLPDDIALQDIGQQPGFHPRFDARSRAYCYTVVQAAQRHPLMAKSAWVLHNTLDLPVMQAAAALLIGTHDFGAFGQPPQGENTVREVLRSGWAQVQTVRGEQYIYEIEANAFLYHMVRRIVGALVDVGRGWLTLQDFDNIFRTADLSQTKTMAPPQGLILMHVQYGDKEDGGEDARQRE
ncbi:MAG: tRNA pseudouridine(38-40) synthase TruA [Anaerolineae bacterium]